MGGTQWKELTSKKGAPFKAGKESTKGTFASPLKLEVETKGDDFGTTVEWPVVPDITYPLLPDVTKTTGITDYQLAYNTTTTTDNKYMLSFNNTLKSNFSYFFHDQTGDSYQCDTSGPGSYAVSYNSTTPTILYISGAKQ